MYTLIGHPQSRAMRVIWALEEMGLEYQLEPELPRSERVRDLNGTGKIPVLIADGVAIADSVAILTFLADRHGQLTHPAGSLARARQDAALNYVVAELDAALWLYAKHSFALPEALRVPAVKDTARAEFDMAMTHLALMRGAGPYLCGETFTIADIVLSHCAGWALSRKFALPEGEMGAYLKDLRKRPAMGRVLEIVASKG